jgi:hypothetical protein
MELVSQQMGMQSKEYVQYVNTMLREILTYLVTHTSMQQLLCGARL